MNAVKTIGFIIGLLLIISTAQGATILLPETTYAIGTYTIPAAVIPQGFTFGYFEFTRGSWTNTASTVSIRVELSIDNGATWPVIGEASFVGGIQIDPITKLTRTTNMVGAGLRSPELTNRRIRGQLVVNGGPITTEISGGIQ